MARKRKTPPTPGYGAALPGAGDQTNPPGVRPRPQPVRTGPSTQYGSAAASARDQNVIPLPDRTSPPDASGSPGQNSIPGQIALPPLVPPDAPTQRPEEPITAGLSRGPGPGPEVLGPLTDPATADLAALAPYLPGLQLMADRPTASIASRNFVRRLIGGIPLEARRPRA